MAFVYRDIKGIPLTSAEGDANFREVETKYLSKTGADAKFLTPTSLVVVASSAVIAFTKDAEYPPLTTGTFTVSLTGAVVGKVVVAYLNPGTTEPVLSIDNFQLISGSYAADKELMYVFKVGANGKIQYTITTLP